MAWNAFLDDLRDWLHERGLLEPHKRWVLGVSGGPDSTLLAHAFRALTDRDGLGWKLHLAHLHHGMRGQEADDDEAFVRNLAEQLAAVFITERADIPAEVATHGGSTEEVAREHRYEFLERTALRVGAERVAVAHHADDDAETILHRICRGTGLRGLAGMPAVRPIRLGSRVRLVRPFLAHPRRQLEELVALRGFACRHDSTNTTLQFTRGRIRHQIMPLLRETLNPNIVDALLRLSEQASWLGTYLQDAAARTFDSLVVEEGPGRLALNTHALLGKQKIIQAEVVRLACSLVLGGEQDLGFTHIDAVLRLAADKASGKELHLPGPVLVRKQYDRLDFRPLGSVEPPPEFTPVFVQCPGTTRLPLLQAELTLEEVALHDLDLESFWRDKSPYEEWLDLDRVVPPLLVRGRLDGDRFHPLGAPGAKTLAEFFIDEKIDPWARAVTGVLCDQTGPLWVMPLRIDERVKLRPTATRALRLTLRPDVPAAGGTR